MSSHFKVLKVTDIKNMPTEEQLPESDFSLFTSDDKFVQFKLIEAEREPFRYKAKPGIFAMAIQNHEVVLVPASFTDDKILEEYLNTKMISDKIDKFFSKLDVYKDLGIFPKRAALLYGSPGCGKSQLLSKLASDYTKDGNTLVVIWPTDKLAARDVKNFIKSFEYSADIKKFILIMEDLGGAEVQGHGKSVSDSSLLSLLDNIERTFTVPTMIIATTNYPENFLENLTDRPQRFDDVIEVKRPEASFRSKFLEFFGNGKIEVNEEIKKKIQQKEYDNFSIAHIKEIVVRSLIYDISIAESIDQIQEQSARAQNEFTTRRKMGF